MVYVSIYRKYEGYNGGYLFLQKIYYELGLDYICKKIAKKHKLLKYDLTNYFFEWEEEGGLVQFGHCKEGRSHQGPLPHLLSFTSDIQVSGKESEPVWEVLLY